MVYIKLFNLLLLGFVCAFLFYSKKMLINLVLQKILVGWNEIEKVKRMCSTFAKIMFSCFWYHNTMDLMLLSILSLGRDVSYNFSTITIGKETLQKMLCCNLNYDRTLLFPLFAESVKHHFFGLVIFDIWI